MINKFLDRIAQTLLACAALLSFALAFVVCADIVGRYFFGKPLKGTPEMAAMAIVIVAYLQAPYAVRSGSMLAVDALYMHYPTRLKSLVSLVGSLLGMFLFALICAGGSSMPSMHGSRASTRAKAPYACRLGLPDGCWWSAPRWRQSATSPWH